MQTPIVGNTHIVAGGAGIVPEVLMYAKKAGITLDERDTYTRVYAHFGIDEAREIIDRSVLKAVSERRVFVLAMPDMTREAQNALLKTLEEPHDNALFFFIVPAPDTLLPTLRSRMQVLRMSGRVAVSTLDTRSFLAAEPARRVDMLKPLLEKGEDDRRDMSAIISFLTELESLLGQQKTKDAEGLRAVYRARRFLGDKGALVKPLLEQVALLISPAKM